MTDPEDIRNFVRMDERITTSGRVQEADPARLAAIGVRHVVNLALDEHPEALPDESAKNGRSGPPLHPYSRAVRCALRCLRRSDRRKR